MSSIKVANISSLANEDIVRQLFSFIGEVKSLDLHASPYKDGSQECVIEFTDPTAASVAMHLTGTELGDHMLLVTTAFGKLPGTSSPPSAIPTPATASTAATPPIQMPVPIAPYFNNMSIRNPLFNPAFMHMQYDPSKLEEIARTIYVGSICPTITEQELVDAFSTCGKVVYVKYAGDPSGPARFAFLEFGMYLVVGNSLGLTLLDSLLETIEAANEAMKMSGTVLGDRPIKLVLCAS
jgi:hypothetical protein